ncbi:uncharacterized protein M421DRAFT_2591 [Didymella exigua CBS 183.55]|uniref:Uncharacterized protein n=1 Tax=Didymella exigua CBS 183.55 TaxID=1150837 RepID=A0A6A5RU38_9PLEO|nr:uncharacterized protein M421DRAFT_2591 [Didymella exigua CBS 183.55]KAF1931069.1 hypothetical protein M421DRAFT_2591 [Didymella exigua CBS 183.55]
MMIVLWDDKKDTCNTGDLLLDLKPPLYFRAFCKWFTVRFESRQLAKRDYPHEECEYYRVHHGLRYKYPAIFIRFNRGFAPRIFSKKTFSFAVCQYLTDIGMIELEEHKGFDSVMGIATGKVARHSADCKTPIPVYNQYTIYGRDYEETARTSRPAKIGTGD